MTQEGPDRTRSGRQTQVNSGETVRGRNITDDNGRSVTYSMMEMLSSDADPQEFYVGGPLPWIAGHFHVPVRRSLPASTLIRTIEP